MVHTKSRYYIPRSDRQHALNVGLNVFGGDLLAESFEKVSEEFPGGICLEFEDHSHKPVWITLSYDPPEAVHEEES